MTIDEVLRLLLPGMGNAISSIALLIGALTYGANRQDRLRTHIGRCAVWLDRDARGQWYLTVANSGPLPIRDVRIQVVDAASPAAHVHSIDLVPPETRSGVPFRPLAGMKSPRILGWEATDSNGRRWAIGPTGRAVRSRKEPSKTSAATTAAQLY